MPHDDRERGEITEGRLGVVVLGHGSRCSGAADALARLAGRLEERLGCTVLPASLQFNRPTLEESCRGLAVQGVTRIVIVPYFLFNGNHLQKDIPHEIETIHDGMPEVELFLAGHLGEDESLVDILERRVEAVKVGAGGSGKPAGAPLAMAEIRAVIRGHHTHFAGTVMTPEAIEAESFAIIDGLLKPDDSSDPRYQVIRRVVHATGDPELAAALSFSPGAIEAGQAAIADAADIWCDVHMVASGVGPTASRRGLAVNCAIDDRRAAASARERGITRAAAALGLMAADGGGRQAVIAIGNAPTALFECLRLCEEGLLNPALIVGVPVGFVGAAESKQALAASGLPHITIEGNRGGSSVAVAIVNALIGLSHKAKLRK